MINAIMIQTLDIITVNIWLILISFANLIILFFILKKFLYKPVKKMLESRNADIEAQYNDAEKAKKEAYEDRKAWNNKLASAQAEADAILKAAEHEAGVIGENIVSDANKKAEHIMRRAENEIELERRQAEADIKKELADVSAALAGKMLEREINKDDHRDLIASFINEIGDSDGGNA